MYQSASQQERHSFSAEENTMNIDPELLLACEESGSSQTVTPSVDFINAISEFFDTSPNDLLVELGYYTRDEDVPTMAA
jgi:hypothetical protein